MLKAPADFPHNGADAYVKGTGLHVRIIQTDRDGISLVTRKDELARFDGASRERREPLSNLVATLAEAFPPKRSRARRSTVPA